MIWNITFEYYVAVYSYGKFAFHLIQCKFAHKPLIHGVVFLPSHLRVSAYFFNNIYVKYRIFFNAIIQYLLYESFQENFQFLLKKQPLEGVLEINIL